MYFSRCTGPLVSAVGQLLAQQDEAIRFPQQRFQLAPAFTAKQEKAAVCGIHLIVLLHKRRKPPDSFAHIRASTNDVYILCLRDVA